MALTEIKTEYLNTVGIADLASASGTAFDAITGTLYSRYGGRYKNSVGGPDGYSVDLGAGTSNDYFSWLSSGSLSTYNGGSTNLLFDCDYFFAPGNFDSNSHYALLIQSLNGASDEVDFSLDYTGQIIAFWPAYSPYTTATGVYLQPYTWYRIGLE